MCAKVGIVDMSTGYKKRAPLIRTPVFETVRFINVLFSQISIFHSVRFPAWKQIAFHAELLVGFHNHLNLDGNIDGQNGRSQAAPHMEKRMDRTQEAKSFQPRPFAAKMSAKPYAPTAGSFLPLGNILNIMSDTRYKQRIPNRNGDHCSYWVFFTI